VALQHYLFGMSFFFRGFGANRCLVKFLSGPVAGLIAIIMTRIVVIETYQVCCVRFDEEWKVGNIVVVVTSIAAGVVAATLTWRSIYAKKKNGRQEDSDEEDSEEEE